MISFSKTVSVNALVLFFALLCMSKAQAQQLPDRPKEVVQFSGIVKDKVSGAPVPFSIIYVDKERRGTVSTLEGFFSFAVAKGDFVIFKSLGYKPVKIQVPYDAVGNSYYRDIELPREVYTLDTLDIYPLPQPHQLRQAMINLDVPETMVELAKRTIENSRLEDMNLIIPQDGVENFNRYVQSQVQTYYSYGQPAPIRLFDAFSWAKFIQSLRGGPKKSSSPTPQEF